MTVLHAQPYDPSASGFYFESLEEFQTKVRSLRNDHGDPVEEFEIQFINGEATDGAFAEAVGLHQGNVAAFFRAIEEWEDGQRIRCIIAVGECGSGFNFETDDIDLLDVDLHGVETLRELAEQFVEDGYFGDIPKELEFYIDYDAIARDLAVEYSETTIAGERFVYRCG